MIRLVATWESFKVATSSLRANKLRTALTLMGIIVGVTAVIAVVTIIKGLDQTVAQTFSSQGSTVFTISKNPQIIKSREEFIKFNRRKDVTHEDAEAIARLCSACWRVGIAANAIETVKYADQKAENVRIRGVDPITMFDIDGVSINVGRIWTESEGSSGREIAVVLEPQRAVDVVVGRRQAYNALPARKIETAGQDSVLVVLDPGDRSFSEELEKRTPFERLAERQSQRQRGRLNALVDGAYAGDYYLGADKIDLTIKGEMEYAQRTHELASLPIATPTGQLTPLSAVADGRAGDVRRDAVDRRLVEIDRHHVVPLRVQGLRYGGTEVPQPDHHESLHKVVCWTRCRPPAQPTT